MSTASQQQLAAKSAAVGAKSKAKKAPAWPRIKGTMCKIWKSVKWILLVVLIFAALAAVSIFNSRRKRHLTPHQLERIRSLLQYASKSADEAERIAEEQPIQALLHADYAVTYFSAARHLVDEKTIESLLGTDFNELQRYLQQLQQRLLERVYAVLARNEQSERSTPATSGSSGQSSVAQTSSVAT